MKVVVITLTALFAYTLAVPLASFETNVFNSSNPDITPRIRGGRDAKRWEVPYQVALLFKETTVFKYIAGGSIISPTYVLTAAHVILSTDVTRFKIRAGGLIKDEDHADIQTVNMASYKLHPQYPGGNVVATHDMALIVLADPFVWTDAVKPIYLPPMGSYPSGNANASGWGALSADPTYPSTLQIVNLPIITINECIRILDKLLGKHDPLDDTMVCTAPVGTGTSVCDGDSGGPLAQRGLLVGIIAWNVDPCGTSGAPSIYTNAARQIFFIQEHVKDLPVPGRF